MQDWQLAMSVLTYILFTPHLHLQCKPLLLQRRRGRTPPRPYLNPTTSGYGHAVPIPEFARKATRACRSCPVPTPQHIYSKLLGHPTPIDPDPPTPCRGVDEAPAMATHKGERRRSSLLPSRISGDADQAGAGPKPHLAQSATTHGGRPGPPALPASDRCYAASLSTGAHDPNPKS